MNAFKNRVIRVFNTYKCKDKYDELKLIPIHNESDELIGFLKPITFQYNLISPGCVSLISTWRKENPIGFATVFEITDQRTEKWLNSLLLNREDRVLFMIESLDRISLGHLGLSSFNYKDKSCEIDNVVRGIKQSQKGIMSFAMNSIIHWGLEVLRLENIYLRVLSDNTHAIKFYENLGFTIIDKIPLYKEVKNDETRWIEEQTGTDVNPDRYYSYMKLSLTRIHL